MTSIVALVARREIVTRLQQKGFRIGFGLALLVVVAAAIIPSFFSDDDGPTRYDVALTAQDAGLQTVLAASTDPRFTVHPATAAQARTKVDSGDWDAAVIVGDGGTTARLVVEKSDSGVVGAVQRAWSQSRVVAQLRDAGLGAGQAQRALTVDPLPVSTTAASDDAQRQAIALITVVVLFSQLITFCTWVAMGVVEEKASRVVELMLSAIRPLQLLAGKLIGIGLLAAGQVLVIGVVALVAASAAGTISVPASALVTVIVAFVGFVLGFAFFSALAAAMASTVSRQEEVSGVLTPVTLGITACYLASFATASDGDSTLARVLSIVPPISSISMPSRIARGDVPVIDVVLAVALLALAAAGVLAAAARIYRASVLHSGTRVPLATAWRGEPVGSNST